MVPVPPILIAAGVLLLAVHKPRRPRAIAGGAPRKRLREPSEIVIVDAAPERAILVRPRSAPAGDS